MPNELDPLVGQWYLHRDKGEMFRAVALDSATGYVEIQSFAGDVEEVEMDAWRLMDIEAAEAPQDWTGPFDEVEPDDLGYTETAMCPQDWRLSPECFPAPAEPWQDELDEAEEGRLIELYAEEDEPVR